MEDLRQGDDKNDTVITTDARNRHEELTPIAPLDPYEIEEDAEERLAKSRDRNREHARRTRLRKKAQLQSLQNRVQELDTESRLLRQTLEKCSIASILLGLSGNKQGNHDASINSCLTRINKDRKFFTMNGKRKRFVSDESCISPQPMKLVIKGRTTLVGSGNAHINWKTGVYIDERGYQQQLSPNELDTLRRERNRMHAKMTRDRKKLYISSVEKTIKELENENQQMRELLAKQATMHSIDSQLTTEQSPALSPVCTNFTAVPEVSLQPFASKTPSSPESSRPNKPPPLNASTKDDDPAQCQKFSVIA